MTANALDSLVDRVLAGAGSTVATSRTLPPQTYTSQAFFDVEVEKIFRQEWHCVCHVSEIAATGDYFCFDLLGEPLVAVRGPDRIRVLSRVCRHRWAPVTEGKGNTKLFSCPFHKWAYGLDGRLLGAPFMEAAAGFDVGSCRLPEFRVEVVEPLGLVFMTFSERAGSIADRLGDLCERLAHWRIAELVTLAHYELDSPFNWKIQIETGMECYHHIGAHPTSFEVNHPGRLSWCEESRAGWTLCHSPSWPDAPDEVFQIGLPVFPDLEGDELRSFDLYHIYPLTRINTWADRINISILSPIGPNRTRSRFMALVRPEVLEDQARLDAAYAKWTPFQLQATAEDVAVNSMQQKGAGATVATPGRLSHLEATVWHLAEYVRARLAAN
jgi:phenylpropionate dioxygenase-like ring-hydroxylating dioxygenase large terminal subunit